MALPVRSLQVGASGSLPTLVLILLLVVVLAAVLWFAAKRAPDARATRGTETDVVCPRCHHTTDPTSEHCPECGKELR